jgi:hypothetical protein
MMSKRISIWAALIAAVALVSACEYDLSDSDGGANLGAQGEGGGFVWKPRSESDGRLVVLLPPQYRGAVQGAFVADAAGVPIEVGNFAGDEHNGLRPHYRFSEHGSAYGNEIYVVADLVEGGSVHWPIPAGAQRMEY